MLICVCRSEQEGLINAFRHTAGSSVEVTCAFQVGLAEVTTSDVGPGFGVSLTGDGLGLAGLRERAERIVADLVHIVVAHDHPRRRGALAYRAWRVPRRPQAGTADEAVAAVEAQMLDFALLEVSMPGSGPSAAAEFSRRFPAVGTVMLTVSQDDVDPLAALRAGARGNVLKRVSVQALIDVLHRVADGASFVSPALAARVLATMMSRDPSDRPDIEPLSKREQ